MRALKYAGQRQKKSGIQAQTNDNSYNCKRELNSES